MQVDSYDSVWIVGDDFVNDSAGEFFQLDENNKPYLREEYGVKILCSNSLSLNKSVTARLHNNVVNGIKEEPLLPKAIIFVIDADIIKTIDYPKLGISEVFGQVLKNLMVGLHRLISAHKDVLPARCKKDKYPMILWTLAPVRINFPNLWNQHRRKFNQCIEKLVPLCNNMAILKLLKIWNYDDIMLFSDHRFTARGLSAYWSSVDSTFRHWDTFVFTKKSKGQKKIQQNPAYSPGPSEFVKREN